MIRTLVLGLGNDLAADDAIGLLVARAASERLGGAADVLESSASGMALIELLAGYDRAVVIDAILTGRAAPGTITERALADVGRVVAPSLHNAGLPELALIAGRLGLTFPRESRVLAIEVADPYTLGGAMSLAVAAAAGEAVRRVCDRVRAWAGARDLREDVG